VKADEGIVIVRGLKRANVTDIAMSHDLEFTFAPVKAPGRVEVVSAKVETIAK
jgi:hypothetical protein